MTAGQYRSYTISVSAGPTSFLQDLNTLTEISESMLFLNLFSAFVALSLHPL